MVTCDNISSYSLQKLGSSSASTCVWELGKEPRERCHGHAPSLGTAFGKCLKWEELTSGAFGRI